MWVSCLTNGCVIVAMCMYFLKASSSLPTLLCVPTLVCLDQSKLPLKANALLELENDKTGD